MKTTLTIEQSSTLINKGVSEEKASIVCIDFNGTYAYVGGEESQTVRDCVNGQFYVEESRVFTLTDLLSLLPKTLNFKDLYMECLGATWEVGYRYERKTFSISEVIHKEELIDALYELVIWCIDNLVGLDWYDDRGSDR